MELRGNRQIRRAGGKLVALFVDLRAAFDSVDRRVLVKIRRKDIRERQEGRNKEGRKGL